ncbi:hypothetical protein H0H93_006114 [Arthromyces matolae]|nr:hypothetical protein H0H93_006114 [Arthromyces matolae]
MPATGLEGPLIAKLVVFALRGSKELKDIVHPDPNKAEILEPLRAVYEELKESTKLLTCAEPYMKPQLYRALRRGAAKCQRNVQTEMDNNTDILAKPFGIWWFKEERVKARVEHLKNKAAVITGRIEDASNQCMERSARQKKELEAKAEHIEMRNRIKQGCLDGAMLDLRLVEIGEVPSNRNENDNKLTTHQAWIQSLSRVSVAPQLETVLNPMPSISALAPSRWETQTYFCIEDQIQGIELISPLTMPSESQAYTPLISISACTYTDIVGLHCFLHVECSVLIPESLYVPS